MALTIYQSISQLPKNIIYQLFETIADEYHILRHQQDSDFMKNQAMTYLQHYISFGYQIDQSYFFSVKSEPQSIKITLETDNGEEKEFIGEKCMAFFLRKHYPELEVKIAED